LGIVDSVTPRTFASTGCMSNTARNSHSKNMPSGTVITETAAKRTIFLKSDRTNAIRSATLLTAHEGTRAPGMPSTNPKLVLRSVAMASVSRRQLSERPRLRLIATAALALVALLVGCSSSSTTIAAESDRPFETAAPTDVPSDVPADAATSEPPPPTQPPSAQPTTPPLTVDEPEPESSTLRAAAPNGRVAPTVALNPVDLAQQIAAAEEGLALGTVAERAQWGHLHQVGIRKLGYEPDWDVPFFEALPQQYHARTLLHVSARRALIDLSSGYDAADFIPAWEIVEPESAEALISYYQEAEAATGIEWEFLAAINLVETGMGRIRGLSSAGAQGPMQFLPTTWAESGIGEGDINDPRDAINSAARYLVRRGGPSDMAGAIWGYNNSDDYVTAVRAYAELIRQDPQAYEGIYNWEIYFFTEAGDIWLPTGFRSDESINLYEYLEANPWSAPDRGIRMPGLPDVSSDAASEQADG